MAPDDPVAYSVLLNGACTRTDRPPPWQYRGPDTDNRLTVLREIANEVDATVNQVVIAWLCQADPPSSRSLAAGPTISSAKTLAPRSSSYPTARLID
jgi:hypothetical protein